MEKLKITAIHSLEVDIDNSQDAQRSYDVKGRVTVGESGGSGIQGSVQREGVTVATFNVHGGGMNKSITFNVGTTADEDAAILADISAFIAATAELRPADVVAALNSNIND